LPERHLAHGERRAGAAAMQPDDDAFEHLNAFLVALADLDVHADGIARFHRRPLGQLRLFYQLNRAHVEAPSGTLLPPRPNPRQSIAPPGVRASVPAPPASASAGFPRGGPTTARLAPAGRR